MDAKKHKPWLYAQILFAALLVSCAKLPDAAVTMNIAKAGSFQTAVALNLARKGCLVTNTSTTPEYIYDGFPLFATRANSLVLAAGSSEVDGGTFTCNTLGHVLRNQISIMSLTPGASYSVISQ